jgi:hypothetical protein
MRVEGGKKPASKQMDKYESFVFKLNNDACVEMRT